MIHNGHLTPIFFIVLLVLAGCSDMAVGTLEERAAPSALLLEPVDENIPDEAATNGRSAALYRTDERARFTLGSVQDGTYTVNVRARGDSYQGPPTLRLDVDGETLGERAVEGEGYLEYTFGEVELFSGQVLEAVFTDDNWGGSEGKDRNLYVDQLTLTPVGEAAQEAAQDTVSSCTDERIDVGPNFSAVWTSDAFEGSFCRDIAGDGERLEVTLDAQKGGFDTDVVRRGNYVKVDELRSQLPVSSSITPNFSGSGVWWVGPKFSVVDKGGQGRGGDYENYVVENASRAPEQFHERFTRLGTYLGETYQDGGVYKHYRKPHKSWTQFWAVRQDYRESGTVDVAKSIAVWRQNGLPNRDIGGFKINVETGGEVNGTLTMDDISFPASLTE